MSSIARAGRSVRGRSRGPPARTLVFLGSEGHTAEMLNLLAMLDKDKFAPSYYVAAVTDSMSLQKARAFEESLAQKEVKSEGSFCC